MAAEPGSEQAGMETRYRGWGRNGGSRLVLAHLGVPWDFLGTPVPRDPLWLSGGGQVPARGDPQCARATLVPLQSGPMPSTHVVQGRVGRHGQQEGGSSKQLVMCVQRQGVDMWPRGSGVIRPPPCSPHPRT